MATILTLHGDVATHGAGLPHWGPDGPAVLWDHGPTGVVPASTTVPCPCGGEVTIDVPWFERDVPTVDLAALSDGDLARLDLHRADPPFAHVVKGFSDLTGVGVVVRHDDHDVLVALAEGEKQPGRDVGVLHGVVRVEVRDAPASDADAGSVAGSNVGWGGALVFLSVVVLALGGVAWLHLDVWTTWAEQQRAEASGERVDGIVTDLRSSSAPRTADQFRVEAAVDGTDVVAYVDEATYGLLDVGDPVALAAIPGPANEYVVVGNDDPGTALAVLTLVDVVLVVLVVVAVVRLRRRLAGDATPAR